MLRKILVLGMIAKLGPVVVVKYIQIQNTTLILRKGMSFFGCQICFKHTYKPKSKPAF